MEHIKSKSKISSDYLDQQKSFHPDIRKEKDQRNAIVVGSDRKSNIGSSISNGLRNVVNHVIEIDITDFDVCSEGMMHLLSSNSQYPVDTLVLANGETHLDWIEYQPREKIISVIQNSLMASVLASQEFIKATLNDPGPKYIVFIGSMAYRAVLNASAPYCAAKAGLAHYAKCLAWELAPKGYNVFCVHPSNTIGTPMTEKTIQGLERYRGIERVEAEAYWGACLPKQEWLRPENIANTVSWLVGGEADYLSGSNIDMAGGQR